MCLQYKSFENTVGKEELSAFSLNLQLSSAKWFSMEEPKFLFGKRLTLSQICPSFYVSAEHAF